MSACPLHKLLILQRRLQNQVDEKEMLKVQPSFNIPLKYNISLIILHSSQRFLDKSNQQKFLHICRRLILRDLDHFE